MFGSLVGIYGEPHIAARTCRCEPSERWPAERGCCRKNALVITRIMLTLELSLTRVLQMIEVAGRVARNIEGHERRFERGGRRLRRAHACNSHAGTTWRRRQATAPFLRYGRLPHRGAVVNALSKRALEGLKFRRGADGMLQWGV